VDRGNVCVEAGGVVSKSEAQFVSVLLVAVFPFTDSGACRYSNRCPRGDEICVQEV
jgi:hypothetical protein